MPATTTLLGLVTPTQGTLSGTWGDTVNYGISDYVDISVAGTLTLTNDGAVTLANTTGSSAGSNITSSLTGAGTVTAQFAIVKVTGTLTTAKVVTGPSYSKTYTVVNSATGGIVTFKASGQTGVSVAVGETAFVYFNGTDYVKVAGTVAVSSFQTSLGGLTPSTATTGVVTLAGTLNTTSGGTGLASYTAGDLSYYASGTAFTKLAIGTAGQILTSSGSAPQWSTLSGVAVTTFSAGTTGFTPNTATSGAITLAGTLATTNGGTGLTSFTSGGVVYASSTSALATGSALTFNGTALTALNNSTAQSIIFSRTSATARNWALGIDGDGAFRLTDSTSSNVILSAGAAGLTTLTAITELVFKANNTEQMRLTSTGLGIGTTSPTQKLDVVLSSATAYSSGVTGNGLRLYNSSTTTGQFVGITFNGEPTSGNGGLATIMGTTTGSGNMDLTFSTRGSATLAERARIDSSGNVGIGTTSPVSRLHVLSSGLTVDAGTAQLVTRNDGPYISIGHSNWAGTSYAAIGGTVTDGTANTLGVMRFFIRATTADANLTERMRLDTSGNLMVGTTTAVSKVTIQDGALAFSGNASAPAGNVAIYRGGSADNLIFSTGGSERGRIGSGGQFLFGNSTENVSRWGRALFDYPSSTSNPTIALRNSTTRASGNKYGMLFADSTDETNAAVYVEQGGSGNNSASLLFGTNAGTGGTTFSAVTERMRITAAGAVSIAGIASTKNMFQVGSSNSTLSGWILGNNSAGSGGIWSTSVTPSGTNYTLLADGGTTTLNSTTATVFAISNSEKARISSSGNFGIGTSSPAAGLHVSNTFGNQVRLQETSGTFFDIAVGSRFDLKNAAGTTIVSIAQSGAPVGTQLNLDSSGRLGLSVVPSAWISSALQINQGALFAKTYSASNTQLILANNAYVAASTDFKYIQTGPTTAFTQNTGGGFFWNYAASGSADAVITYTTLMTLETGGNLLVGTTTSSGKLTVTDAGNTAQVAYIENTNSGLNNRVVSLNASRNATSSEYQFFVCSITGVETKFIIQNSGNAQNRNNSYGAISDAKLKENIVDATPKLADLMQVKIRNYNFRTSPQEKQIGVVAQELETIFPSLIDESKDRDEEGNDLGTTTKAVKYSVFVPMLIKAIQEQQAIIESLKARLDAANL